ncbi:hypothetical protein GCM10010275_24760 [Streptomyces litmocidini]|uniref:hypothetical protein n=1 Tax=Streptomyces litmocidini TaxID=67318 RepID=UPI00167E1EB2|nr:hypothetical protein [Streptomyces litmocidini]GGU87748.1 hypothetical protein GCM10010275_24760 [Streptomyces litmocidini]
MELPSWQDDKSYKGMARTALWLEDVVGVGNIFTMAQLRDAFPGVAQIDRRMRELRKHGWRIDTNREDISLKSEERRYVTRGADVWIPGQVKPAQHEKSLTANQRVKIWQADGFLCRTCGAATGESVGEGLGVTTKLNVSRRKVRLADGTLDYQNVTECERCSKTGSDREINLAELMTLIESLAPLERRVFAGWLEADRRSWSTLEKLWGIYRTLPEKSRAAVIKAVSAEDN